MLSRMGVRGSRFGCALLLAALLSTHATAQERSGRDDPQYRELIRNALSEYELGNWAEAKLFFSDAHAIYPNARTLRGLGLVAYAMRDYVQASDWLSRSLESQEQPLVGEMRTGTSSMLEQSQRFEARVRFEVSPRAAELSIDDQPVQYAADGTARLNPGAHEITARLSGYEYVSRQISLEAGARRSVQLQLRPTDGAVASAPAAAALQVATPADGRSPEQQQDSGSSIAPWLVIGVSGAVAIVGGVLLASSLSDVAELEDPAPRTEWSRVESTYEGTAARSGAGIALLSLGLAGVAVGVTWTLWPDEDERGVEVGVGPLGLRVATTL
jgi:hypothetical protein